jgi:DNA modification methylase
VKNTLYYGDNLQILRTRVRDESVHLCYIDPPFNSQRNYNQIYNRVGREDEAQEQAFIDTWKWEDEARDGWHQIQSNHEGRFTEQTIELIKGLHSVLGEESLLAYLISIALRLAEINRVLAPTGSFYLHCDPTASHYLKIIIDSIFLPSGGDYKNEIIWRRSGSHNSAKRFGPIHDVILYYSKGGETFFRKQFRPYLKEYVLSYFKKSDDRGRYRSQTLTGSGTRNGESGKPWRGFNPTAKGRHWAFPGAVAEDLGLDEELTLHEKLDILREENLIAQTVDGLPEYRQYLHTSRGVPIQDIWAYQPYTQGVLNGTDECIDQDVKWLEKRGGAERIGYPTQKPEGLLERIIQSSTVEGQIVLDAYCGCGTTVAVAERLKRNWIGIDITYHAIATILARLEDKFGKEVAESVVLDGIPKDMASVDALAHKKDDRVRKEFEKWAILTYTNNRAVIRKKKGADGGIDGVYYFWNGGDMESAKMVLQAKSGGVQRKDIAALRGDMEKHGAALACLITRNQPTEPMRKDARAAGFYENKTRGIKCDRIRIVHVEDMIRNGERIELPLHPEATNRARRDSEGQQMSLNLTAPASDKQAEPKKEVTSVRSTSKKRSGTSITD